MGKGLLRELIAEKLKERNLFRARTSSSLCLLVLLTFGAPDWTYGQAKGSQNEASLRIQASAQTFDTKRKETLFRLDYRYEFTGVATTCSPESERGKLSLYVDGLGYVPLKGRFVYFSESKELTFRECGPAGAILAVISPLQSQ